MTDSRKTVKRRVLAPVNVTLLVPVDVDLPDDIEADDNITGIPVADIQDRDDAAEIIAAVVEAFTASQEIDDAMGALLAGAMSYQRDYPTTRGRYTPCLGLCQEQEI